ncbi:hypothetical protein L1987_73344 [Smallanthus sonchifolius]|uniref:Uncharacterized protein n=1 Tax=Smallanthus sonchifolius TaxID=185202 RepID=A0ACB9A0I6_9ASTR|nr:hypothetical protein L1987_73344 [Smallanthus sonchifolius]
MVVHSAKDLCNVKHFGIMDLYAKVWYVGGGMVSETHTTPVAKNCGSCPVWEFPMEYDSVPMKTDNVLFCEIQHDGTFFNRKIGVVKVPFKDLLAQDGSRENVSYPVKIHSGEVMGLIVLSHKFSEPVVTSSKVSSTSGTKNCKDNNKKNKPIKKVQGKKKDGMMKRVAKNVGTQVASKVVLLAGGAALLYALDGSGDGKEAEDPNQDQVDEAKDPNEDQVDEAEDPNEDQVDEDDDDDEDDDGGYEEE